MKNNSEIFTSITTVKIRGIHFKKSYNFNDFGAKNMEHA